MADTPLSFLYVYKSNIFCLIWVFGRYNNKQDDKVDL